MKKNNAFLMVFAGCLMVSFSLFGTWVEYRYPHSLITNLNLPAICGAGFVSGLVSVLSAIWVLTQWVRHDLRPRLGQGLTITAAVAAAPWIFEIVNIVPALNSSDVEFEKITFSFYLAGFGLLLWLIGARKIASTKPQNGHTEENAAHL
ncbi:MAG: hypothetical protein SWK90_12375 [Chloroflexota bacterium]|nr:hypothetical protein [Chloroflexota bacterium]